MVQSTDATAGGAFLTGNGTMGLAGARLTAGAGAVATAIIRETDGSGRILAKLGCPANESDELAPARPIAFQGNVFVTIAGAGAQLNLFH